MGHPLGYIATDVFARYHRMQGHNVLHTLGYDAFGLPAEQYAVQTGTHPRTTTEANIVNMKRQLRRLGLGHDERRTFATTDTDFYHWTQWIFLQIHNAWFDKEAGKARRISELEAEFVSGVRSLEDGRTGRRCPCPRRRPSSTPTASSTTPIRWSTGAPVWARCWRTKRSPRDGRSDRGNFPVFRKHLQQWMMRITAYSDRLVDDLEYLDWPEKVKTMQRNWIGRSHGAQVKFQADGHEIKNPTVERVDAAAIKVPEQPGAETGK